MTDKQLLIDLRHYVGAHHNGVEAERLILRTDAALDQPAAQGEAVALPPIERDDDYDCDYIPLPGGWEIQTKGRGSSARILDTKPGGDRFNLTWQPYVLDYIERMAREIHAASTHPPQQQARVTVTDEIVAKFIQAANDAAKPLGELFRPIEPGDVGYDDCHQVMRAALEAVADQLAGGGK